jgi:hypothetical protein
MTSAPITVSETIVFQRTATKILSIEAIDELVDFVARHPSAGDVIEGTGGLRKLRWRLSGRGKRGGARVIYYFHSDAMPLLLLLAYSKSAVTDITANEKRRMAAVVAAFVKTHQSKRSKR